MEEGWCLALLWEWTAKQHRGHTNPTAHPCRTGQGGGRVATTTALGQSCQRAAGPAGPSGPMG